MNSLNDPDTRAAEPDALTAAVSDARTVAQEQVFAALRNIFEEPFSQVEQRLREQFDLSVGERAQAEAQRLIEPIRLSARRESAESLNNFARRLRLVENRDEAVRSLLAAAGAFCAKAALFAITPEGMRLEGSDAIATPLRAAPAFASAAESRDTVVAAATPGELSTAVTDLFGAASEKRVYLMPLVARGSAFAVLYAEAGEAAPDVSSLELLAALAAPALEGPVPARAPVGPAFEAASASRPGWSDLSRQDQAIHLRAQRYARTKVAELVLHHIRKVRQARGKQDLYSMFREEIDAARSDVRRDFFEPCSSMVDYFHLELVRTLAKDDPDALGPDYPGPLS